MLGGGGGTPLLGGGGGGGPPDSGGGGGGSISDALMLSGWGVRKGDNEEEEVRESEVEVGRGGCCQRAKKCK